MSKALESKTEREQDRISIQAMTPDHYAHFIQLAQEVWPGITPNAEYDFVAITDHGVSLAAFEGDQMRGASFNMLRLSEKPNEFHILVHMIGIQKDSQGKGIGRKLMEANYNMITSGELPNGVREVRLTSDPLESKNVMFYLHHLKMHVSDYKLDPYKSFSMQGGEQHRGYPSDRFLYKAEPTSFWVKHGLSPTPQEYIEVMQRHPESIITIGINDFPEKWPEFPQICFVEIPFDIASTKLADEQNKTDVSYQWVRLNARVYPQLFVQGYSAVDATIISTDQGTKQFVVLLRNFDEHNPQCLREAVSQVGKET